MEFRGEKIFFFICLILLLPHGICAADNPVKNGQTVEKKDLFEGFIYFADEQKIYLKSVKKNFPSSLDSHQMGQEIIRTLIEGPALPQLEATWPKDTKINSFFITNDGKAYIDLALNQKTIENMDTRSELLAIYSMVNSLTLNIPKIKMVKILVQGNDALTLAGHVDLEYFYKTNMLIVK